MSKRKKVTKLPESLINDIKKDPRKYASNAPIEDIVNALKVFSSAYYNTGQSIISDADFDILRETLQERDPENEYLKKVGAPIQDQDQERIKIQLPYPMGSLDKIKPEKTNLDAWLKKYKGPYVLSDKLDGVSLQLYKEKDNQFKLYTRGDGQVGGDVTHLLKYVLPKSVKKTLIPVGTSIRGEAIISKNNFKLISDKMKNARNATSGVVNSKTVDEQVASLVQFVAYSIIFPEYKQTEQMKLLEKWGFNVVNYKVVDELNYKQLTDLLKERREKGEYEVDGIVVVDSSKAYKTTAGNPDHAFAFKTILSDQYTDATVIRVIWTPSMDGFLKPSIEIYPVELTGVTVKHATAFNAKFVKENKLGPGAVVKLIRSGDVIPHILEVITPAKTAQMPDIPFKWTDTGVDIILQDIHGAQLDIVQTKLISHFFKSLDVKNISEGIVAKLVSNGYNTIPKILGANKEDLSNIEGLGKKSIDKIFANIDTAIKNTDLATFMAATHSFGRLFGRTRITEIVNKYPDIMTRKWTRKQMIDEISNMKGFSINTATQFADHFNTFKKLFENINKVYDISHLLNISKDKNKDKNKDKKIQKDCDDLLDANVVFTGFRDKDLEKKVKDCNGKTSNSVSHKTSMVVALDTTATSSKLTEARKLGIKIISKAEFIEKYKLLT